MPEIYRNFDHSRAKAIKAQCFECSGFNRAEVRRCTAKGCALWAFRLGYEVNEDGTPRYSSYNRTSTLNSAAESDFFDEDDEILDEEDADANEDEKRNLNEEVNE